MKTLHVTGSAGCIGSDFIRSAIAYSDYKAPRLDSLTYLANLKNLSDLEECDRPVFVRDDMYDRLLIRNLADRHNIDAVVGFTTESTVDTSIEASDGHCKNSCVRNPGISWYCGTLQKGERKRNKRLLDLLSEGVFS